MKKDNIIRNSVSPFNFPLVAVTKNSDSEGKKQIMSLCRFSKIKGSN